MTTGIRSVAVKQLPEKLKGKQARHFVRDIKNCMNIDRPHLVIDCSNLRQLDRSVIHLLLLCLEEAMKRKGDVKLSAIPAGAGEILELTGVSRLFDIFDTTADAVKSFDQLRVDAFSQALVSGRSHHGSESAA